MVLLDNFGSIKLYANQLGDRRVDAETFKKESKHEDSVFILEPGDIAWQIGYTEYILVNANGSSVIGYSYSKGISNDKHRKPNFMGITLKIQFTKESLMGITEEYKAKITSDILYCGYFVGRKGANLAGIRDFYDSFKFALDSRRLKKLKEYIKVNTNEHYDVTYTDLRLTIMEYYGTLMGLDILFESTEKYKKNLRNMILPEILDKLNYGKFINREKLRNIVGC